MKKRLSNIKNIKFSRAGFLSSRVTKISLVVVVILIAIVVFSRSTNSSQTAAGDSDEKISLQDARAFQELNKDVEFPIKDSKGEELGKLRYSITSAEVRDQLIVQNKLRGSIAGRTYLVLNLKITNPFEKAVEIQSRNYVRLSSDGKEEWLAPDLHNDPVQVQAISTKLTRIAFPVYETDKDFVLQIGEISGEKTRLELDLTIK